MAAYRQDECNERDWDDPGFYAQRSNQQDRDQYLGESAAFDFASWVPGEDHSPIQTDAPVVSLKKLVAPAPYIFDSSKC